MTNNLNLRNNIWHTNFTDPGGNRIRISLKTNDLKLAKLRVQKMITESYEKGYFNLDRPSQMPFIELAEKFLQFTKDFRPLSHDRYYSIYVKTLIAHFENSKICDITPEVVMEFQKIKLQEKLSPISVNHYIAILKRMFNYAVQISIIKTNPIQNVELIKIQNKRIRFLSTDEILKLIQNTTGYLRQMIILDLHTGLRYSELLSLRKCNINFDLNLLFVEKSKNKHIREIPLSHEARRILLELCKTKNNDDYVFTNKSKAFINIHKSFSSALKRAGIEGFRFHDIRKTFASHAIMSGTPIVTVKELLGHRRIESTLVYASVSPEHKKEAIAKLESSIPGKDKPVSGIMNQDTIRTI